MSIELVDLPKTDTDPVVEYTVDSLKRVVIAVAHLLDHFADNTHPGLLEPQNVRQRVHGTSVLVYPKMAGHPNRVGFQLFVCNPLAEIVHNERSSVVGVMFDMRAYEQMGDKYLFNMLSEVARQIRDESRPSEQRLKELSTQFLLAN